jgi:hypothetical protein
MDTNERELDPLILRVNCVHSWLFLPLLVAAIVTLLPAIQELSFLSAEGAGRGFTHGLRKISSETGSLTLAPGGIPLTSSRVFGANGLMTTFGLEVGWAYG